MDVSKELLTNYDALRKERGWSWDQMADYVEPNTELAAELRKQSAGRGSADSARKTPPKDRTAPSKPTAAK